MAKAKQGLNTLTGAATDDALAGEATPLDDTLTGAATDDTLPGEATPLDDTLTGAATDDALAGEATPLDDTLTGAATDDALAGAATPLDDTLTGAATDDALAGAASAPEVTLADLASAHGITLTEAEDIIKKGVLTAAEQSIPLQDTLDGATQDPEAVTPIDPIVIKGWMDVIEAAKFGPFDALRAELERCGMDLRAEGPYHVCELAGVRSSTLGDARSAVFAWTNAARRALNGVGL